MNKRLQKILLFIVIVLISSFCLSTFAYQRLVNEGSILADNQCMNVNPYIIERKKRYIASLTALKNNDIAGYERETVFYFKLADLYVGAQKAWLEDQEKFINRWDYKTFNPSYITKAGNAQFAARKAEAREIETLVEMYATKDKARRDVLSRELDKSNKKAKSANEEYNRIWDNPGRADSRARFIKVPASKCPDENFEFPDVEEILNPEISAPDNDQPLS